MVYEGRCPQTGQWLQLPRTAAAEAAARTLMAELALEAQYSREGKMYGVLLVQTPQGETLTLKAFSGLLNGSAHHDGWVPPIPGRAQVALQEAQTLRQLDAIRTEILALESLPEHHRLAKQQLRNAAEQRSLLDLHQQQRQQRHQHRQSLRETFSGEALTQALQELDRQSQQAKQARRRLKARQDQALAPLKQVCEAAQARLRTLKQERKSLSQQLQAQMHAVYWLTNFAGDSRTLQTLLPQGLPTGTGDCAAPKLLHYAACHGWQPLGLAEFWWGPDQDDKRAGIFYGPCVDRCQPIMGFLLSGAATLQTLSAPTLSLAILYQDEDLIAVDKPAGLLSVPGRTSDRQDCVLYRLQHQVDCSDRLWAVHRLDQDTSGVLILARHFTAYQHLSQQFARREVTKQYEAIVTQVLPMASGKIELPLWANPSDRPRQQVNAQWGKWSCTLYKVLSTQENTSRVEFRPLTGRTHQIRVHAAQGLGAPIHGDKLYGNGDRDNSDRLLLHATAVEFIHPRQGIPLRIQSPTPF